MTLTTDTKTPNHTARARGGLCKSLSAKLTTYKHNVEGTSAVIFGLATLPVIGLSGFAIDYSRLQSAELTAAAAVDIAVVATVRELVSNPAASDAKLREYATDILTADLEGLESGVECTLTGTQINRVQSSVIASADCQMPTTIAGVLGFKAMAFNVTASAERKSTRLDLALMLDLSGSMRGSRINALQDAAIDAIDTLITPQTEDRSRIGLAPYNNSVNAGSFFTDVTDLDANVNRFSGRSNLNSRRAGFETRTCVTEREGIFAKTDRAPSVTAVISSESNRCPSSAIMPITSDADALKTAIRNINIVPQGRTAGHLGIEWAWYLVAEPWADIWPAQSKPARYDDENTIKAVILMTDGLFNEAYDGAQGNSERQALKACDNMRDEGVVVYSVAFQAPASAQRTLRRCASGDDRFFAVSSASELRNAYAAIATELNELRLTS